MDYSQFHPRQFDDADEDNAEQLKLSDEEEYSSEEEDDDDEYEDYYDLYDETPRGVNCQLVQNNWRTPEELSRKFSGKINVDKYDGASLKSEAACRLISSNKKITAHRKKVKDKEDRATVEQVMDPRTRMILFKMLNNEKLNSIDGCISTGKEANVYHGTGGEGNSYAIKIFKTSILTFKARDKYVSGEYRFRKGYCKKNPRKMVKVWAEKEFRNLLRIYATGVVKCPKPFILKSHVLIMEFMGEKGWPWPLLKDVDFNELDLAHEEKGLANFLTKLYKDCLVIIFKMYKICKLVHADFSEFNLILMANRELCVIDVSQSVEHDHPRSFDFLRSDIKNIQEYFGKRRVLLGEFKRIFDWVTSPSTNELNYDEELEDILSCGKDYRDLDVSEEVFRQVYIPKKMNEVEDYERDYNAAQEGSSDFVYANLFGMKPDLSGPAQFISKNSNLDNNESDNSCNSEDESDEKSEKSESGDEVVEEGEKMAKNFTRPQNETPEEKKERKKAVKEQKAEKRANKMKKHVKKRKEKLSHPNSKK